MEKSSTHSSAAKRSSIFGGFSKIFKKGSKKNVPVVKEKTKEEKIAFIKASISKYVTFSTIEKIVGIEFIKKYIYEKVIDYIHIFCEYYNHMEELKIESIKDIIVNIVVIFYYNDELRKQCGNVGDKKIGEYSDKKAIIKNDEDISQELELSFIYNMICTSTYESLIDILNMVCEYVNKPGIEKVDLDTLINNSENKRLIDFYNNEFLKIDLKTFIKKFDFSKVKDSINKLVYIIYIYVCAYIFVLYDKKIESYLSEADSENTGSEENTEVKVKKGIFLKVFSNLFAKKHDKSGSVLPVSEFSKKKSKRHHKKIHKKIRKCKKRSKK